MVACQKKNWRLNCPVWRLSMLRLTINLVIYGYHFKSLACHHRWIILCLLIPMKKFPNRIFFLFFLQCKVSQNPRSLLYITKYIVYNIYWLSMITFSFGKSKDIKGSCDLWWRTKLSTILSCFLDACRLDHSKRSLYKLLTVNFFGLLI